MSIHNEPEKIKSKLWAQMDNPKVHTVIISTIILAVSAASFGLGIVSAKKDLEAKVGPSSVAIEANPKLIVTTGADYASGSADRSASPELTGQKKENLSNQNSNQNNSNPAGSFVASKKGKKYYPTNCPAAKNLSQTNVIYFKDAAEAEAKGYTKASGCK